MNVNAKNMFTLMFKMYGTIFCCRIRVNRQLGVYINICVPEPSNIPVYHMMLLLFSG